MNALVTCDLLRGCDISLVRLGWHLDSEPARARLRTDATHAQFGSMVVREHVDFVLCSNQGLSGLSGYSLSVQIRDLLHPPLPRYKGSIQAREPHETHLFQWASAIGNYYSAAGRGEPQPTFYTTR